MKRLFYVFIILSTFQSCAFYFADKRDFRIKEAEANSNGITVNKVTNEKATNIYEDSILKMKIVPYSSGFSIDVKNKYNGTIEIAWNKSSINFKSINGKLTTNEGKYIDATRSTPNTPILKNSSSLVYIFPSTSVDYKSGKNGGWTIRDFMSLESQNLRYVEGTVNAVNKEKIKLGINVKVGNSETDYLFMCDFSDRANILKSANGSQYKKVKQTAGGEGDVSLENNTQITSSKKSAMTAEERKKYNKKLYWRLAIVSAIVFGLAII